MQAVPPQDARRLVRVCRRDEDRDGDPQVTEDRPRLFGEVTVGVVHRHVDGPLRQAAPLQKRLVDLLERDGAVSPLQMLHLLAEGLRRGAHEGGIEVGRVVGVRDPVVRQAFWRFFV